MGVLISKASRKMVYEHLFKEGVMVVQKAPLKAEHDDITVPNLEVMMMLKSLHSRDLVTMKYNWRWYYYYLSDEGIEFLREFLNLPAQAFPATLTKQRTTRAPTGFPDGDREVNKGKGKGKSKGWGKSEW
eukprot:NODE_6379_length_511_cov_447.434211.p2 GENE.NODE_6379_length_511_cov_447.434211~~NODE_6379_length_511_cov_447.434211.p2  ORF type:complete len:141 (-),score=48.85 NODE_6379_length_511_cov_447.434211:75-464(-)